MKNIVLGTSNTGKIREIEGVLEDLPNIKLHRIVGLGYLDIDEDQYTLEGNATKKATEIQQALTPGQWVMADDTGLFVEYLSGQPGVHTARFAGENATDEDNRKKMLQVLDGVEDRSAEFRTVIVVATDGEPLVAEGVLKGYITTEERGDGGFGYDSIFVPEGYDETLAEMDLETKNSLSHRYIALEKLRDKLKEL